MNDLPVSLFERARGLILRKVRNIVRRWYRLLIILRLERMERPCPVCNSSQFCPRRELVDRFRLPIIFVQCVKCGLIYQNPFPTGAFLKLFYEKDYYRGLYWGTHVAPKKDYEARVVQAQERVAMLASIFPGLHEEVRFLDYGSGVGAFSEELQNVFKKSKVDVYDPGTHQGNEKFHDVKYDCISLIHVLEHLYNPLEILTKLRGLLKDDGILYIEVPDQTQLRTHKDFHIAHVTYFSSTIIVDLLTSLGFSIVDVRIIKNRRAFHVLAKRGILPS